MEHGLALGAPRLRLDKPARQRQRRLPRLGRTHRGDLMPHRPIIHARDHGHGGADPAHIVSEVVSTSAKGRFSKIKWGTGLAVTDEGAGVIRVAGGGGGTGL